MRKVHVYDTGDELYASAAETVPAVLGKRPFKIIVHSTKNNVFDALRAAIRRTVDRLQYSMARNAQAAAISAACLILLFWPVIYLAIPLPEITLAARIASGACTALSIVALLFAGAQVYRLKKHADDLSLGTIVYRDDGLLPTATAWRQSTRRAAFPWLGLGLILFSIALNCVVVADYARPAILNDGTVIRTNRLVFPWTRWYSRPEYLTGEFYLFYSPQDYLPVHVVLVKYRIRNLDFSQSVPSIRDYELVLANGAHWHISNAQSEARRLAEPGFTDAQMVEITGPLITNAGKIAGSVGEIKAAFAKLYPYLRLENMTVSLLVMDSAEFNTIMTEQRKRWGL